MSLLLVCSTIFHGSSDPYLSWQVRAANASVLPESKGHRLTPAELATYATAQPRVPFRDATVGVRSDKGSLWLGCPHGLMYLAPGAERWRLFHSKRWLPSDTVTDVTLLDDGSVMVRTEAGVVTLFQEPTTLEAKMAMILENLRDYHLRDGFVASTNLKDPGDITTSTIQESNDNDGLWTALYVAAEAFRYGATGASDARKNARASLEALMFLEQITGISGFAARSVIPIASDPKRHGGEWHPSKDGTWWWKGDTSSDEVDGHYFAYSIYHDIVADEAEKKEIAAYVARITDHIIDNGFYYVGPSGKPTSWGVWAPEKLNHDLRRFGDRGLNSLEILSFLKVAEHIVGDPKYAAGAKELIEKHSYATNTIDQKRIWPANLVNHSDDELAFLAYYPLLMHERDPELRKKYLASITRTWLIERPEGSPFFNFIYAAALQANQWMNPEERPDQAYVPADAYDQRLCVQWFEEVPADTTSWTIRNSHRQDIDRAGQNRFRKAVGDRVLLIAERHVMRWNGDPYLLDGGDDGRERDDGTAILLPYWMGRYHRLMD